MHDPPGDGNIQLWATRRISAGCAAFRATWIFYPVASRGGNPETLNYLKQNPGGDRDYFSIPSGKSAIGVPPF